ncbi:MAG TPA: CcdB family protein [Acetobacteraceae bacterium]|jgi:toxin CcdB
MARLDVYRSPGRAGIGYVLDVQADLLSSLATRTVVLLVPESNIRAVVRDLNPVFEIDGQRNVMLTQAIATVPLRELRHRVASLSQHHDAILRALDILLTGI